MAELLNPTGLKVAEKRYFARNEKNELIEDWLGLATRVVNYVCQNENLEFKKKMLRLIANTYFLPNSPCLVNAGKSNKIGGLMACFVTPPPQDCWSGHGEKVGMVENIANFGHIARKGGGAGVSLSDIRPAGDPVFGSTHARACGPIEHMRMISEVMSSITQAGFRSMACLAGDTQIRTIKGQIPIVTIVDQQMVGLEIPTLFGTATITKAWHNGKKEVFEITTSRGHKIKLTADHVIYLIPSNKTCIDLQKCGIWKKVEDIQNELVVVYEENGFVLDSIQSIVSIGEQDVYDISTTDESFLANNIVVHNCMATLRVDHPDIFDFIQCKQRERALRSVLKDDIGNYFDQLNGKTSDQLNVVLDKFIHNFNISVVVTDDFMKRVEKDKPFDLVFGGKVYRTVRARDIFDAIVTNAWKNGDPGIIYYDAVNNGPYKYSDQKLVATNPCGEQPMPSYGVCDLGSIDISKYFNPETNDLDWDQLKEDIHLCVQFLDDVIEINSFPTPEFESWAKNNRPIGLGIMGLADLFMKMKLAYGSEESIRFSDELMKFFYQEAHNHSVKLGKERGTPLCCRYDELDHRRNITLLTIAPTGSISLLAGCSSSIEPIFAPVVYRTDNTGNYDLASDNQVPWFRCALDPSGKSKEVTWEEHVKIQSVFQKYTCSGVSKTINMNKNATQKDIANAYMMAWKMKCKGLTVYRDGSKSIQILNADKGKPIGSTSARTRPLKLPCRIHNTMADGFEWHIMVGLLDDVPYEVFAVNGKQKLPETGMIVKRKKRHYSLVDSEGNELIDNIAEVESEISPKIDLETRRCSMELRHGIHPKFIVQQIDKSECVVTSFEKAIGRVLKKYLKDGELTGEPCSECQREGRGFGKIVYESGCKKCLECKHNYCG